MATSEIWRDEFTGTIYRCTEAFRRDVAEVVALRLAECIENTTDTAKAADEAARFWRDGYYNLVFPLRLRLRLDVERPKGENLFGPDVRSADLDLAAAGPPRTRFVEPGCAPAVLPARAFLPAAVFGKDLSDGELLADRVLAGAALVNVLLRRRDIDGGLLHAVRLGCLTYPLLDFGRLRREVARFAPAEAVAEFLAGKSPAPVGVPGELLRSAQTGRGFAAGDDVTMVLAAAQRIKRYVFETAGLNEIRGASTLLDQVTERLAEQVGAQIGPEAVLRAAGSTLHFLCDKEGDWLRCIRRAFAGATGVAEVAVAALPVLAKDLFSDGGYRGALERLSLCVEADRDGLEPPNFEVLPFEARCALCGIRPAEGWGAFPESARQPVCRPCATKRRHGRDERGRKTVGVVRDVLGNDSATEVEVARQLGAEPAADDESPIADDLEGLLPEGGAEGARRGLLGVVYADGDNFGQQVRQLRSIAQGLQWTHRVAAVTRAATGIAVAEASVRTSRGPDGSSPASLRHVPFQVLAIGGDDVSLFAYAPVAMRFAERFVHWTDLEFKPGRTMLAADQRLSFSMGVLLCDVKAPVQRTVDFAEHELMRWAKAARRKDDKGGGRVAAMLTVTPEQIPADLEAYQETMYVRDHGPADVPLCLTLRPFSASELEQLVALAENVAAAGGRGVLQRTVGAFFQTSATEALLHYVYQAARESRGTERRMFAELEGAEEELSDAVGAGVFRFPATALDRRLFGRDAPVREGRPVWFSPLWDLLELVKILE